MKFLIYLSFTMALLMAAGCASTKKIQAMRSQMGPKKLEKNIEKINKMLVKTYTEPDLLAEVMDTGAYLSKNGQLSERFPAQYEALMNNYQRIRSQPPIEKGLFGGDEAEVNTANTYLFSWSIYCSGRAGGYRLPDDLIRVFDELDSSVDVETGVALLSGLEAYLPAIQADEDLLLDVLDGIMMLGVAPTTDPRYYQLFLNVEEGVASLPLLNRLWQQRKSRVGSATEMGYLIWLNERVLARHIRLAVAEMQDDVVENISHLSVIALPQLTEFPGGAELEVSRDRSQVTPAREMQARATLLKYAPLAYWDALMRACVKHPASLKELLGFAAELNKHIAAAETAEGGFYSLNGLTYLNPRAFYGDAFLTVLTEGTEQVLLDGAESYAVSQDKAYRAFYYSHLYALYPNGLAAHLTKALAAVAETTPELLIQQALCAANLAEEEGLQSSHKTALHDALYKVITTKINSLPKAAFTQFYTDVAPFLIRADPKAFVRGCETVLQEGGALPAPVPFTDAFLEGMCRLEEENLSVHEAAFLALLNLHDAEVSSRVIGYYLPRDFGDLIGLILKGPLAEEASSALTATELELFGALLVEQKEKLEDERFNQVFGRLKNLIRHSDEGIGLRAAYFANELEVFKTGDAVLVVSEVNKRWNGVEL